VHVSLSVNGRRESCLMLAVQADRSSLTTVEGLAADGELHPLQQAFADCHGLQCGFCTPGFLISAVHLLAENPDPSREDIRTGLSGHICRCTGYVGIVDAVHRAAAQG
jgi:carbon-monoxide dehydrogenase small subunit